MSSFRTEKDLLGEKEIPNDNYFGIHTTRSVENFPFPVNSTKKSLIHALAKVKKACVSVNSELDFIPENIATAISQACSEVSEGKLENQFPTSSLQGGAGTSTNMNVNEVLANRALEILGKEKGDYKTIHPLETVNLHQSTNDVYPTALKVAAIEQLRLLSENCAVLQQSLQNKEQEFAPIVKVGMTELQEAVPLTLGVEFGAFADTIARDRWRSFKSEERLRLVNLGGTAIGTGLTAPKKYIFLVIEKLRSVTGLNLSRGENCVDQTANNDIFIEVSGCLKALAANLMKIARDLRLLHMKKEINLPPRQAGSSIMPGKVNPVICETVIQTAIKIKANDMQITEAVSLGSLQINEFMPLIAESLLESLELLNSITIIFAKQIDGITANEEICRKALENSETLITALLPFIGYEKATNLLEEFHKLEGISLFEFLETKLGPDVRKFFTASNLTSLGY